MSALSKEYKFSLDTPFEKYPKKVQDILIHGTGGKEVKVHYQGQRGEGIYDVAFEGLIKNVERRYRETGSETMKAEYEEFMRITPCHECGGQRLKPEALAVTVGGKNIAEVTEMSIEKLQHFLEKLELTETAETDRRTDFKRNTCKDPVFDGCRSGLFDIGKSNRFLIRRRSTENSSGYTDWLRTGRCGLYFR